MRVKLPDVTLVNIHTNDHELSRLVIRDCLEVADFADCVVVSDIDFDCDRFFKVPKLTKAEVMRHRWQQTPFLVKTSHMLIVEWDSGIINPDLWTDEFLNYDYIGAPWKGRDVGNGGFSLRSTRLMLEASKIEMSDHDWEWEDASMCGLHRKHFEDLGFKWAPRDVARRFSYGDTDEDGFRLYAPGDYKSFGFHGFFNWPRVYNRNKTDEWVRLLSPFSRNRIEFARLDSILHRDGK